MTNSNTAPDFAGFFGNSNLFGSLLGAAASEFFPGQYTSTSSETFEDQVDVPQYKKVSELSIGTKVVLPSGDVDTVVNLGRVDDDLIEIVFAEFDDVEMWKNAMLEVK